jgi:Zn-dependent peptidase ImmA (M78 family)
MVNGDRVKQARELNRLTQKSLADSIGLKQSAIAQIESGRVQPSEHALQGIAFQTAFPLQFFRQPDAVEFPLGTLLFRAKAEMSARERNEARQLARTVYEEFSYLRHFVRKSQMTLPRVDESPSRAATITRSSLGLSPDSPIGNLIRSVERAGVVVIALPKELKNRDAFSAWVADSELIPVVVLSKTNVGDRLRFSIAHEIGHLVLHHSIKADSRQLERESDQFAAELLLPEEAMKREMLRPITITSLASLKPRWKVSIQTLARRAFDLGYITERQYRYLMQQISRRGWRTREPFPVESEKPRAFRKMAELVYGNPNSYKQLASAISHPASLVRATLEAHEGKVALSQDTTGRGEIRIMADYTRTT